MIKAATFVSLYLSEHTLFLNMSLHQGGNEDPVWVDRRNFAEILPKFCRNFAEILRMAICQGNIYRRTFRPRLKIRAIALVTGEAIANVDGKYRGEMPKSEKLNLKFF